MCKKHAKTMLIIVLIISLSACSEKKIVTDPNQIGSMVFEMLKNVHHGKQAFINNFPKYDVIKQLKTDQTKALSNEEDWKSYYQERTEMLALFYDALIKAESDGKIKWSEIQLIENDFRIREKDKGGLSNGKIRFKHKDKKMGAEYNFMSTNDGYVLATVRLSN